jgi:hypothetical protein
MPISTIVVNWNRKTVLEKCLQSYAVTIDCLFQLIIIDNSDASREVIERFCAELPDLKPIFLDRNHEGEVVNQALEPVAGDLIHIGENDQIYLARWPQYVRDWFSVVAGLGQLSQSADMKKLGLLCVWSDRDCLRNLAREYSEFARDPDYYRTNDESKPWLAGSFFRTPRGIFVGAVQKPAQLPFCGAGRPARNPLKAAKKRVRERAAILILGMHRSGTSALARVLNLLGAELPEDLLAPGHGNSLGHWESKRLMEIDNEVLLAMGRTWDDPREIPSAWFRSRTAYTFHERLQEVIASEYGDAPLIVIKEPRICRLAPLYLDVLDALGMRPYVVLPVRHPAEVIRSISERNGLDPVTIELLWLRHVVEAEKASRSCRRVWTSYDRLLRSWAPTAQAIAYALEITWPNEPETVRPVIEEFLRPRHRHYRIDDDPGHRHLGRLTTRAWEAIQRGLDGNEMAAQEIFDEINSTLEEFDRSNFPREEAFQRRLVALETERKDQISCLNNAVEALNDRISSMLASRSWRITAPLRALQRWILGR